MKEEICRKNICLGNGQEIQARQALKKGEMTEKEMWNRERNKKEKDGERKKMRINGRCHLLAKCA